VPIAKDRSSHPEYACSLKYNLPGVYGLYSLDGYDPLTEHKPQYREVIGKLRGPADQRVARTSMACRWFARPISGAGSWRWFRQTAKFCMCVTRRSGLTASSSPRC
jgi:hypothetical protein